MKKNVLTALLIFAVSVCYAENFSLQGKYFPNLNSTVDELDITTDTLSLKYEVSLEPAIIQYQKIYKDGLLFFKLSEKLPKEFHEDYYYRNIEIDTNDELLILAGNELDFSYLKGNKVETKNRVLLFGTTNGFEDGFPFLYEMFQFTERLVRQYKDCSSYLKEKNKSYPVQNLDDFSVDTPWVEGVKGDGIGEGFTIVNDSTYPYLLIMNGYISYRKPYLYKQNNRIKKIKVIGLKSGKTKKLDVLDTPHPQTVDISFITEPEDIRIEIEDVYKGNKYDDTCLHFCVTYPNKVIPYEECIIE